MHPPAETPALLAPRWHTLAFVLLLGSWAAVSSYRTHDYAHTAHPVIYLSQIMMTWMLFGTALAGIFDRRGFFAMTLRHKALPLAAELRRGFVIYIGFYAAAFVLAVLIVVPITLHLAHKQAAKPPATASQSTTAPQTGDAPTVAPPPVDAPKPFGKNFFGNSKTVRAIAPRTPLDFLFWIAVSFTAAFCEEHVFRGYLLAQSIALMRGAGASLLLANVLSITVTSVIFGSLHLYEGVFGAILIAALGAVYCVVSMKLGNLRAVIVAHFLQDFVAGLFMFLRNAHPH